MRRMIGLEELFHLSPKALRGERVAVCVEPEHRRGSLGEESLGEDKAPQITEDRPAEADLLTEPWRNELKDLISDLQVREALPSGPISRRAEATLEPEGRVWRRRLEEDELIRRAQAVRRRPRRRRRQNARRRVSAGTPGVRENP